MYRFDVVSHVRKMTYVRIELGDVARVKGVTTTILYTNRPTIQPECTWIARTACAPEINNNNNNNNIHFNYKRGVSAHDVQ